MYNFPIKIKKIIWFLRSILNFSIQQNLSGVRDKYESVDISDICVLLRFLWWVILFCKDMMIWGIWYQIFLIFVYCRAKVFWWVILQRKGVDRAAGCLRNFCNKTIQTNLKRHVFGNLAVLAVFFGNKVMQQINYPRNSILSKYWHCNASCFNHVNPVSIIAIWRDLKREWWSWFCWKTCFADF